MYLKCRTNKLFHQSVAVKQQKEEPRDGRRGLYNNMARAGTVASKRAGQALKLLKNLSCHSVWKIPFRKPHIGILGFGTQPFWEQTQRLQARLEI